jgi:hypothetical protein
LNRLAGVLKQGIAKIMAYKTKKETDKWSLNPVKTQNLVFKSLLKSAQNTKFGRDHNFSSIHDHQDFVKNIPIRDYEGFKPYVDLIKKRKKKHLMERSSRLFCNNLGNNVWHKVYTNYKRKPS